MALEFLSDAATEDAELFINLDVDGLDTLLRMVGTAMGVARAPLHAHPTVEPQATAGSGSAHTFRKVTVTFDFSTPEEKPGQ